MQTDEFVARVEHQGPGLGAETARAATLATLQALCAHLPATQTHQLASQLPQDLAQAAEIGGGQADRSQRPVELSQFYADIAGKTGVEHDDAARYARAVTRTLHQAVTNGEISDVALDLPEDLAGLLAA